MSYATCWDVMCDCSGCSGCTELDSRGGCGVAQVLGLMDTKGQAAKEAREMNWSVSRRNGQDHARCPDCKGRREGINVPKQGDACPHCPKGEPDYVTPCKVCFGTGWVCSAEDDE